MIRILWNLHAGLRGAPRRERWTIILCTAIIRMLKPTDLYIVFDKKNQMSMDQIVKQTLSKALKEKFLKESKEGGCDCEACKLERIQRTQQVHLKNDELQHFLAVAVANEMFEAATAIRNEAQRRNIKV